MPRSAWGKGFPWVSSGLHQRPVLGSLQVRRKLRRELEREAMLVTHPRLSVFVIMSAQPPPPPPLLFSFALLWKLLPALKLRPFFVPTIARLFPTFNFLRRSPGQLISPRKRHSLVGTGIILLRITCIDSIFRMKSTVVTSNLMSFGRPNDVSRSLD